MAYRLLVHILQVLALLLVCAETLLTFVMLTGRLLPWQNFVLAIGGQALILIAWLGALTIWKRFL